MSKHTPGHWTIDAEESALDFAMEYWIKDANGEDICSCSDEAEARRIVACVNRLQNFTTEQIEDYGYDLAGISAVQAELWAVQRQRDELLAVVKQAREYINENLASLIECERNPATGLVESAAVPLIESDQELLNVVDAAIAKAEGAA